MTRGLVEYWVVYKRLYDNVDEQCLVITKRFVTDNPRALELTQDGADILMLAFNGAF
jgi:hypothetical protein